MTDWYNELTRGSGPAPASPPQSHDWYAEVTGAADAAQPAETYGPPEAPYSGSILPISRDAKGNTSFDSNAGLLGAFKRAFTAPGDVLQGKVDPYSEQGRERAFEAASVLSPAGAGSRTVAGMMRPKAPATPTAEELRAAASQGYKAVRKTGAEYDGQATSQFLIDLSQTLQGEGFVERTTPQTLGILRDFLSPTDGSTVTITSLDAARKALGKIGGNFNNPTEQEAARRAVEAIDSFIASGGAPGSVAGASPSAGLPGPWGPRATDEAARLIVDARGNAAARFRSDRLTGIEESAELRAAATNSGQNLGNTLRQRLASLLSDPKKLRGYSDEEIAAMREIVEGTPSMNSLRYLSNIMGGGGGLGASVMGLTGAVGAASDPKLAAIALLPFIGASARAGANRLTSNKLSAADELVRQRSPLYQQRVANPEMEPSVSPDTVALLRLLLAPQQVEPQ